MSNSDFVIENGVLTKYNGPGGDVVIPDGVTSIGDNAFCGCYSLTSIVVPNGVTSIGGYAFHWCSGLTNINISESVTSLGNGTFESCQNLVSIAIPDSVTIIGKETFSGCCSLTSIVIPSGVTSIGDYAFSGCSSLASIIIPKSVTSIGKSAFGYCDNLTSIVIPNGVSSIGEWTFSECKNLTNIVIPDSVKNIGAGAFSGCRGLADGKGFVIIQNVLFSYYGSDGNVLIPDGVTSIGEGAFKSCDSLTNIVVPDSVTSIGDRAFCGCHNLTGITIPGSVTNIGDSAFSECSSLKEIVFSGQLAEIGTAAFKGCDELHIMLPGSITETQEPISGEITRCRFDTTDAGLAHLLLFQRKPLWKRWRDNFEFVNASNVFACILAIIRSADTLDSKLGAPISEFILKNQNKLERAHIREMLALFEGRKCKEMDALLKDDGLQLYLEGKEEAQNPAEAAALELLSRVGAVESVEKVVNKGVHYRDSKKICSREVLISILSFYAKEWERCAIAEGKTDEYAGIQMLRDATEVQIDSLADRIAECLDTDELSVFLEKRIAGSSYRLFLLAWARFASEKSVEAQTVAYRSLLRGKAREQYFAQNLAEALMINRTQAAMLFFDRNNLLDRYAAIRGTTAMELRDTQMLPDFGFDPFGAKLFDIGGNIIEARLTERFGFELFDRGVGKTVRSFPKKSDDPAKAKVAAETFKAFKKQILDFVKLRTELLCRMHQSGETIRPEIWQKIYLNHPVIKLLSEHLVWMDEAGVSFILQDGAAKDVMLNQIEPMGAVHVAHVMELSATQADAWRQKLTELGRVQLFEQVWEPIISYQPATIPTRYSGIKISSAERNALKAALKQRGIEVYAGEMCRDFDAHTWKYEFWGNNTMYFGNSLQLDYSVDEEKGILTFGKASLNDQSNGKELNAILLELDKIITCERIRQDNPNAMQWMDEFTLAQIMEFIAVAQEANAINVLSLLMEYKNNHYADFDPMAEFVL